jgi:hypothetical protein
LIIVEWNNTPSPWRGLGRGLSFISIAKLLLKIPITKNRAFTFCENLLRKGHLFVNKPKPMVYGG